MKIISLLEGHVGQLCIQSMVFLQVIVVLQNVLGHDSH